MTRQTITTAPRSPSDDRRRRMVTYSITMGVRMVCLALLLVVDGWWLIVCAVGAIVLPYFAVVIANVGKRCPSEPVRRPGTLQRPVSPERDKP